MYEAPESRAREARGTHRDVGRAHLWWRQRLEGQWWQQEPRLRQQGLEEPRVGLQESQERTEEQFGAALDVDTLNAFIKNLDKIGLLDTGTPAATRDPGRGPRIRGSLLYLRFAFFDPDRLLARLVPRLRFFFTRRFLVLS